MRCPGRRVVAIVVLSCCGLGPRAGAQGDLYVSEAGNYRVRMPGTPRLQQQTRTGPSGVTITTVTAGVETPDKHAAYAVTHIDMPPQMVNGGNLDAALDGGARGMATSMGATIREQTPIKFAGHPGLDLSLDIPPKGGKGPGIARARVILAGNRFYHLLFLGPAATFRPEEYAAFRDSFSLIRDVPPIAQRGPGIARPMPAPPPRPTGPRASTAFVGDSGPDPAGPAEVEIRVDYDASKVVDRIRPGGFNENPFRDIAPPGGVLVGARVGYVNSFGGSKVGSIRPIYQVGAKYIEGEANGNPAAELGEARVAAKPGYVVAGINYRAGLLVDAVQLVFGRVKGGKVDLRDAYTSPWLGDPGGTLMFVSGEGRFIAGVVGRSNGREINAIGLAVVAGPMNAKVSPPAPVAASPKAVAGPVAGPRPSPVAAPPPSTRPAQPPMAGPTVASNPAPSFEPSPRPRPKVAPLPVVEPPAEIDPAVAAAASRRPAAFPISVAYNPSRLADVPPGDDDPREGFRDVAPRGGVLVGVRVGTIEAFGGDKVGSVQPIYQVGGGYVPGRRHGAAVVRGGSTVMARPGYAVGGLNLRAGLIVDAFQLVFMRVEGGRLNPADTYTSDWIGDPSGGDASTVSGNGRPIVGLRGRADVNMFKALGAVVAN